MTGQTLGNYRILEQAGEGNMGTVYHAIDLLLDREIALKALRPDLTRRADVVGRFREEARVQARLNHPNVAQLYTLFPHGYNLFMVMEFVNGPTLDRVIQRVGRMTLDQALALFLQVVDGVEHAHSMGVIDRDLKPANIMLNREGLVKVTDFGIAVALGSARMTRDGGTIGTLEYMSPERVLGRAMDARSDLYSLGFVLYEMLSGSLPFTSDTEFEIMRAQIETPPPRIRASVPNIPPEIEDAMLKAMAKNPDDRFSSVSEFAAVLRQYGVARPVTSLAAIGLDTSARTGGSQPESRGAVAETRLADPYAPDAHGPERLAPKQKRLPYSLIGLAALGLLLAVIFVTFKKAFCNSDEGFDFRSRNGGKCFFEGFEWKRGKAEKPIAGLPIRVR